MQARSQAEMQQKYLPLLLREGRLFKKVGIIRARTAVLGETIQTVTSDGLETVNTVSESGYIVKNPTRAAEEYFVTTAKFAERYAPVSENDENRDEWRSYQPLGIIRALRADADLARQIGASFVAAWGVQMRLEPGDFLACPREGSEIYRIAAAEFAQTYTPLPTPHAQTKRCLEREPAAILADRKHIRAYAKELKNREEFYYAYRLRKTVIDAITRQAAAENQSIYDFDPLIKTDCTEAALCIYKDTEAVNRFDRALDMLNRAEANPLEDSLDHEILGIAGAVHKYKWIFDNQVINLHRSRAFYLRGYETGKRHDYSAEKAGEKEFAAGWSYNAVNAAHLCDLCAYQQAVHHDNSVDTEVAAYRSKAKEIRQNILLKLAEAERVLNLKPEQLDYWWEITKFEVFMAQGKFERAETLLTEQKELIKSTESWKRESTAKQIATAIQIHDFFSENDYKTEAEKVLLRFLDDEAAAVDTAFRGKTGLALSGGGFRAALYHLGVLASLAERDILRHVEVISCVSGGTVVGALYYLKLREAMQQAAQNQQPTNYIELVRELQKEFLAGVQKDLRNRIFINPYLTLKMIFSSRYNRATRLAEMYDKYFYRKYAENGKALKMKDLDFHLVADRPHQAFDRRRENWCRSEKIPELIINATTLNTGHNWQFTTRRAGEPPATIDPDFDAKYRVRRMDYRDTSVPDVIRNVSLATAVAASSAVPGIFNPLLLENVTKEQNEDEEKNQAEIVLQLSDGGVHDNLGVTGLTEQECTVIILSDASRQINAQNSTGESLLQILKTAADISMERIREQQYQDLTERKKSFLLKDFCYVHLKKEIGETPRSWRGDDFPPENNRRAEKTITSYGTASAVQRSLSDIRTDLDAFHDTEAYALMYSGYQMMQQTKFVFAPQTTGKEPDWVFKAAEDYVRTSAVGKKTDLLRAADLGTGKLLKYWYLRFPMLKWLLIFTGIAVFVGLICFLCRRADSVYSLEVTGSRLLTALVITAILLLIAQIGNRKLRYGLTRFVGFKQTLYRITAGIAAFIYALFAVHLFRRMYLFWGRVRKK